MPRRTTRYYPESATVLTTFAQLREVVDAFAKGSFALLIIMGRPGLGKSRHVKAAIGGTGAGYMKGYHAKLDLYGNLYRHRDQPIVFDHTNRLLANRDVREMIRDLTETDTYKRLEYGSTSPRLAQEGLPKHFHTKSPVCLITNYWDSHESVFQALESRAEFFVLDVDWEELHRDVARWFWDQEILDYIGNRLKQLREPDARLYVKAYVRKRSGLTLTPWQHLVDSYCDDTQGIVIRKLLDGDFRSDNARFRAYLGECERTKTEPLARSNFYARCAKIRKYMPSGAVGRVFVGRNAPPEESHPEGVEELVGTADTEGVVGFKLAEVREILAAAGDKIGDDVRRKLWRAEYQMSEEARRGEDDPVA